MFTKMRVLLVLTLVGAGFGLPRPSCHMTAQPPHPRSQCCGVDSAASDRIIGGTNAGLRQYPWLALIEYEVEGASGVYSLCGGSLISGRYVLSAAHCFEGNTSKAVGVRLGVYDKTSGGPDCVSIGKGKRDCNDRPLSIPIERIITHGGYRDGDFPHDIALLRLKYTAPYTEFIRPICLPLSDVTVNPSKNLRLYAAGWGTMRQKKQDSGEYHNTGSKLKRHVDLPLKTTKDCTDVWGTLPENGRIQICAGGEKNKDTCGGDSGGPLMLDNGGIYEISGIVSYGSGDPCGAKDTPAVYTKVHAHIAWLRKNIRNGETSRKKRKFYRHTSNREIN